MSSRFEFEDDSDTKENILDGFSNKVNDSNSNDSDLDLNDLTANCENTYYINIFAPEFCMKLDDYQTQWTRDEIINILLFRNLIEFFGYHLDYNTIIYIFSLLVKNLVQAVMYIESVF